MKSPPQRFKRGIKKLGSYKPKSMKRRMKKVTQAQKLNPTGKIQTDFSQSFINSELPYDRKVFPGILINQLPNYQRVGKSRHLCTIDDLIKLASYDEASSKVRGMIIFSFLISDEYLQILKRHHYPKVIVTDSTISHSDYLSSQLSKSTRLINPPNFKNPKTDCTFHPKLFLTKYPTHLQVVIGTGNLLKCDWEEYANAFVVKDCPLRDKHKGQSTKFMSRLQLFMQHCLGTHFNSSIDLAGIDLDEYDWPFDEIEVIFNVPGIFKNIEENNTAFHQIRNILQHHPPSVPFNIDNIKLTYVTSSLSVVNTRLLKDIVGCFLPESSFAGISWDDLKNKLAQISRVIYPSQAYIQGSFLGESKSQGLFLSKSLYHSFKFEKRVMRQFEGNQKVSGNSQVTPHLKILIVKNSDGITDDSIVYVGSHNFTIAAWGAFEKGSSIVKSCNYELGCMFVPKKGTAKAKRDLVEKLGVNLESKDYRESDQPFFNPN